LARVTAAAIVRDGVLAGGHRPDLVLPWWSFTKTVIAAAALALVCDGRLVLDRPLAGRRYTLRHLLQHQAGVSDYGGLPAYHQAVDRNEDPWPVELLLERLDADRLRYEPGHGWAYSNVGYVFIRRLIEDTTGLALGCALSTLVLRPLAVRDVQIASERADLAEIELGAAKLYHPGWVYHGLLIGPAQEAALLLVRLLTGGFLPPDLLSAMRGAHPLGGPVPGRPWRRPGYGLGLMTGETRYGCKAEGHTGGGPGSVCAIYHFPDAGPPRTVATFAIDQTPSFVEGAAFRRGRPNRA
jgi:CubicO group peptidase (beta-lactamase class C family)